MPLAGQELAEFEQIVVGDQQYAEIEEMITVYEQRGIEKGTQEGKEEGLQEGLQKGRQDALLLLLRKRFGQVPNAATRCCCWPCSTRSPWRTFPSDPSRLSTARTGPDASFFTERALG